MLRSKALSVGPAMLPAWIGSAGIASAHASEQGLVLLLPTGAYITSGVAAVAATVVLLAVVPDPVAARSFRAVRAWHTGAGAARLRRLTSLAAFAVMCLVLVAGLTGPRDPVRNPLPLMVWTVWWVGLVAVQGLVGDLWRWINPFAGIGAALRRTARRPAPFRLPGRIGHLPAIVTFLALAAVLLADPAPLDPDRLARILGGYVVATLLGMALCGPRWLLRAECVTVLMRNYARVAPLVRGRAGLWGWAVLHGPARGTGAAIFVLLMLGSGSFDGLNETFWWFGLIGLNPLEFPGRTSVVVPTLTGLALANLALIAVYAMTVRAGLWIAGGGPDVAMAFRVFAPSILPIALAYHVAHYLTAFMVDGQYVLAWLSESLGLGHVHVTTGFMNRTASVRLIWLSQAGVVVAGHVLSILLAHALAVKLLERSGPGRRHRAALSQAPLAAFMILYTLFGLWLLAAPRGL